MPTTPNLKSSHKPFFSVVIPTLNEEKFLPALLDDLKNQTKQDVEVFVVDATSKDKTVSVAKSYQNVLLLQVITSKKRNLSYQRNLGAEYAHGDYLIFMDADSRIPDDFIAKLKEKITKDKYLLVLPYMRFDMSNESLRALVPLVNKSIESSQLLPRPMATGGMMIIQRHLFAHLDGFTVKKITDRKKLFLEDCDLLVRAKSVGVMAKKVSQPYYVFSTRRFQKEGSLNVLFKWFLGSVDFTKGELVNMISYEMGGHVYQKASNKQKKLWEKARKNSFQDVKTKLQGLVRELEKLT